MRKPDTQGTSGGNRGEQGVDAGRRSKLIEAAYELFFELGYENVGMRLICERAGLEPIQAYRLGLSKIDLLAEVSMLLSEQQLQALQVHSVPGPNESVFDFCQRYLTHLYASDIAHLTIRRETAAFGWKWSNRYETLVTAQVIRLLQPIAKHLEQNHYTEISARCLSMWSLYYVGFRAAVTTGADATTCFQHIHRSLQLVLPATAP